MSIRQNTFQRKNVFKSLNNSAHTSPNIILKKIIESQSNEKKLPYYLTQKQHPYARKFTIRKVKGSQQKRHNSMGKAIFHQGMYFPPQKQMMSVVDTQITSDKLHTLPISIETSLLSMQNEEQCRKEQKKGRRGRLADLMDGKMQAIRSTKFEQDEMAHYEVHYVGKRRITHSKDFTKESGDARVQIGDAIVYRYEVLSALGQGSFGQVFKALDHRKQELVAVKIIRNEAKFNRQARVEMNILECVLLHDPKLRSNVVHLKHAFYFRGHACLVFQLLHINLYDWLRLRAFKGMTLDLVRKVTIQTLQSLLFFQQYKIIHCDLKPQNIMFKQEHRSAIRVIDVGSGCFEAAQLYTYIQSRFYRAPQIIFGVTYSPAIDIWSYGCIIVELALGYPIFPGESQHDQVGMFVQLLGVPPLSLLSNGSRVHKFFDGCKLRTKQNLKIRKPNSRSLRQLLAPLNDDLFLDFVQQFLQWLPQHRINPKEALLHPWITSALPQEVLKQHLNSISR